MPSPQSNASFTKSINYFWHIAAVILAGYAIGSTLSFGASFTPLLSLAGIPAARTALTLFGLGLIGSSLYCMEIWYKDLDDSIKSEDKYPHQFDATGYAFWILGGGVTGVALYVLVAFGMSMLCTSPVAIHPALHPIIGLMGGLFHAPVKNKLWLIFKKLTKEGQREDERLDRIESKLDWLLDKVRKP